MRAQHRLHAGIDPTGHEHSAPARRVQAHRHRLDHGGRPVVEAGVGDGQTQHLAGEGLELEESLQVALAHLRLVGGVGRGELGPANDRADHGGHVMVVGTAAEPADAVVNRAVASREPLHVGQHLGLGHPVRQVELVDAQLRRHLGIEERVHRCDIENGQHRGHVSVGVRGVVHARTRHPAALRRRRRRASSSAGESCFVAPSPSSAGVSSAARRSPGSSASCPSTSRTTRPTAIPKTP